MKADPVAPDLWREPRKHYAVKRASISDLLNTDAYSLLACRLMQDGFDDGTVVTYWDTGKGPALREVRVGGWVYREQNSFWDKKRA